MLGDNTESLGTKAKTHKLMTHVEYLTYEVGEKDMPYVGYVNDLCFDGCFISYNSQWLD